MAKAKKSVNDLIVQFFKKHPNKDFKHGVVVDYVFSKLATRTLRTLVRR